MRWIETKAYNPRVVHLTTAPVDVGGLLAEHLFKGHDTVVMTSATLAVAGDMSFLKKRTGLTFVERERIQERQFASPFDYADQARLLITDDLPSPDQQGYKEALGRDLGKLLLAAGGRAFVLFTSFRSLQRQYQLAAPMLAEYGIRCLKQGETTRDRLLRAFREDTRSVLFGTDSFWEGVDVEGESLSTVILTRLPFRVPTEPVTIARAEAIEKAGGRAFTEYTIPTAVIKFRQGFGRLIRSRTDRGVVIVTDKRLVSKPYGRAFLRIPAARPADRGAGARNRGPCQTLLQRIIRSSPRSPRSENGCPKWSAGPGTPAKFSFPSCTAKKKSSTKARSIW